MSHTASSWLIYGCYGYSGKLLATEAARRGMNVVLAGRNERKTREVAEALGLPYRVVSLDDPAALQTALEGMTLVLHCAGPFSATSAPMIDACLRTGVHYFDITGEWRVFEHAHSPAVDRAAKDAGVIVCPGSAFDVIPTDCIANTLSEAMPDAQSLTLGFAGFADLAPGTARTMVEVMGEPVKARRNGKIVNAPTAARTIDFGNGPQRAIPFSWGDISTAFRATGIPNITVYNPVTRTEYVQTRLVAFLRPLLRINAVQRFLKNLAARTNRGPDDEQRASQRLKIWGEVSNAEGKTLRAFLDTTGAYELTITGPLAIIEHVQAATDLPSGSMTPAMLMGKDFIARLPDCSDIAIVRE